MSKHQPSATWEVDVFPEDADEIVTPIDVARYAYGVITGHEMLPILTVTMPDGTKHDVDLHEEGL